MWIVAGIAIGMGIVALCLAIKYRMLKKGIRQAGQDLAEIMASPDENRILLAATPSYEVEQLLRQVNHYIEFHQRERIIWQQQERQLQEQIENISHDLRTPLTSILGYLELVDDGSLSGEDQEALAVVGRKSRYLQGLIRNFYDLSRLERADMRLPQEPVEITRLIRETVLSYFPEFEERHLAVELALPESAVFLMGSREALERILHNMIQNALRYARSCFCICVYCADIHEHVIESDGNSQGAGDKQGAKDRQEAGGKQSARDEQEAGDKQGARDHQHAGGKQSAKDRQGAGDEQSAKDRQEAGDGQSAKDAQMAGTSDIAGKNQICLDFINDTEHLTQADIPYLFDRFYTADHARPGGSTGLGLTISKLLAEAMGGTAAARLTEQGKLHLEFTFQADTAEIGEEKEI